MRLQSSRAVASRAFDRGPPRSAKVEARLATAREELQAQREFPHVVVNDRLEDAVTSLEEVVREHLAGQA